MRNVVGEMKQRMHPKIERFTTGCKALGESKKRQGLNFCCHYCSACYF